MRILVVCLVSIFLVCTPSGAAFAPAGQEAQAQDFSTVVATTRPAVFLIDVRQSDGRMISGTGFAVSGASALVTAAHLVKDAREVSVRYADGSVYPVKPIFVWHERDVALIHAPRIPASGLTGRRLPLRVGEPVIVLGYPLADKLGVSHVSVTQGIVSAILANAMQLNAAVNPGNSGGPVLDTNGAVVGMISSLLPGTGFAFATPYSDVTTALAALAQSIYPVLITLTERDEPLTGWIEQGTVLIDAPSLARLLGGSAGWDPETRTLTLIVAGKRLRFVQGSRYMDVDGQQIVLPLPLKTDQRIPLRSVVATLGGMVSVNADTYTVQIQLPSTVTQVTPQHTRILGTASSAAGRPGDSKVGGELRIGVGTGALRIGIDRAQVAKQLGPETQLDLWQAMPGLTRRPLSLLYFDLGISVLLVDGRVWGIAAFTPAWVVKASGLRVGTPVEAIRQTLGFDNETKVVGESTLLWYKSGVAFWITAGKISTILVFQP